MGDIDGAAGAKIYASHKFSAFVIAASMTQYLGDDNDGLLIDTSVSRRFDTSDRLSLIPSIGVTWADGDYTDTFFGVDSAQATASRFSRYDANAGFKDITAGLRLTYKIDQHWSVTATGRVKQLLEDAADSPISAQDTSYSLLSAIVYKF